MKKVGVSLAVLALLSGSQAAQLFVSPTGTGDCSSTNPCSLSTALNTAATNGDNDTIYLSSGVYNVNNLRYAPSSKEGNLSIIGDNDVVLDGGNNGRILEIDTTADNDENVFIEVKNLVFQNGNMQNTDEKGAGLKINAMNADINVEKVIFKNNQITGSGDGGGLYARSKYGNISVKYCLFENNSVDDYSGGADISTTEGNILLSHSIFRNNSGGYGGGASLSVESSVDIKVINNVFINNSSTADGNGRGGGLLVEVSSGQAYIINNTFTKNSSSAYGGGIHIKAFDDNGDVVLYNNIVYGNSADLNGNDVYIETESGTSSYNPTVFVEYNNYSSLFIEHESAFPTGKLTKKNNITDHAPDFVSDNDFHLKNDSYLINKGSNDAPHIPDKDIDGDDRTIADVIDIGADEVLNPQIPENNDNNTSSSSSGGGGGGGCAVSPASSPANALLYLALPFVLFARRLLRG